jgi:PAS domain S-box-containing protein
MYTRGMPQGPSAPARPEGRPGLPTLPEHLERVRGYLRGLGVLAFPITETPLRGKLADFMETRLDEVVRIWAESIGTALEIDSSGIAALADDMREAQARWLAHIRNPDDVETYAVLRDHARGGFISRHPPSRFLASQIKIRSILVDLMWRDLRAQEDLPEMLALLDQEVWARVLHITDFFVEAREQDLAKQSESYRRSIDSAPAIILNVDAETGVVTTANQVARREVSSADRSVIGQRLWDLHPEPERTRVRGLFFETRARGAAGGENLHLERSGRDRLPVDLRTALVEYGDQRVVQAMYVDLSERRRLELQLIQSEKMAAIGQLAAGIAHEIRNPLGIIMNALYDLAELLPDPSPDVREDLQIARVEMARVQEIINNLLEFSRDSHAESQAVDLNALIGRTLKLMGKYLQNHGVQAVAALGRLGPCEANENGLRQVLLNLITNAVQAMPEGGELRLETFTTPSGCVGLRVSDTGHGIPPEDLCRIFDPFYTTKEPGEGTGLGLSVVHSVIKNAGGDIQVDSQPRRGTTFTIRLPAARGPDGAALPMVETTEPLA